MSSYPIVNSYNEWDPLEEVIVGVVDGMCYPAPCPGYRSMWRSDDEIFVGHGGFLSRFFSRLYGRLTGAYKRGTFCGPSIVDRRQFEQAKVELDNFERILTNEGCTVRRPDRLDYNVKVKTPDFTCEYGNSASCPRDTIIVFGDEIVEAPMSWRSRYFEYRAFRNLIKEYHRQGARWCCAPKPLMGDELYKSNYPMKDGPNRKQLIEQHQYPLTEFEPCFDAADILRMGKDVFIQHSLVTNLFGIEWVRRHLGPEYRLHPLHFPSDLAPVHADATMSPLRPGLVITNPDRPCEEAEIFRRNGWMLRDAPISDHGRAATGMCSCWLSMNVLSIDESRVCVEATEKKTMRLFEDLGHKVIPVPFRNFYEYGGAFHCATVDVRRRGGLQCYFPHEEEMARLAAERVTSTHVGQGRN